MMKPYTIIWDFDGTLLPNAPHDSEQSLIMYKLYETGFRTPFLIRALARFLVYADSRQRLRKSFKRFYIRFVQGTPVAALDRLCRRLSDEITVEARQAIRHLSAAGHRMLVLSCGTADLSARILNHAGVGDCFETILANRFVIANDIISGLIHHVPDPEDKVILLKHLGISADTAVAVGDGYTDIPVLDWAKISVMVDRTGQKQIKYARKNYHFVRSLTEILDIVENSFKKI